MTTKTVYRPPLVMVVGMTCAAVLWATVTLLLLVGIDMTEILRRRHVPPVLVFGGSVDTAAVVAYLGCGFVWGLLLCTLIDVESKVMIWLASLYTVLLAVVAVAEGVQVGAALSILFSPVAFAGVRQLRLDRRRAADET